MTKKPSKRARGYGCGFCSKYYVATAEVTYNFVVIR